MPLPKFLWKTLGVSHQNMIDHFKLTPGAFSPLNRLLRAHERRLAFEIRQMLDHDPDERPKTTDICSSLYFINKLNYKHKESGFDKFYGPRCEQPGPELQAEIERLRSQNAALKSASYPKHVDR